MPSCLVQSLNLIELEDEHMMTFHDFYKSCGTAKMHDKQNKSKCLAVYDSS